MATSPLLASIFADVFGRFLEISNASAQGSTSVPAWPTRYRQITGGYSLAREAPVTGNFTRAHRAIIVKNPYGNACTGDLSPAN
jgi:hypothetical protein